MSPETIRLVIWDLDDTFWQGTLTEGGIVYCQEHADIVVELARRGIMSSICSKNEFASTKLVLEQHAIWDYFISPSISWEPKGPRIKAIIEAVQLRPETVLFIDDNEVNLREAQFFEPKLRVAAPRFIADMLSNDLLIGKDDSALDRLAQYKLLERRSLAETSGQDNVSFLRSSNIRIVIEQDIAKHLDRAVELINRTNQLNFTKRRLPGDLDAARAGLLSLVSTFDIQAGLIRVCDDYGDYGICGIFVIQIVYDRKRLWHFCFSCRILNMGIEAFVYGLIGRPELEVVGEVASDPVTDSRPDWVTLEESIDPEIVTDQKLLTGIYLRGGCDMMVFSHYAGMTSNTVLGEYNSVRDGYSIRSDHTLIARYAIEGLPPAALAAFCELGYEPADFTSKIFTERPAGCWILSFLPDFWVPVYRHNATGLLIPFHFNDVPGTADPTRIPRDQRATLISNPRMLATIDALERDFTYIKRISETDFVENLRIILGAIPRTARVFIVVAKEFYGREDRPESAAQPVIDVNRWTRQVAVAFENVEILQMAAFMHDPGDIGPDGNHFGRLVYLRMFRYMRDRALRALQGAEDADQ